MSIPIWDTEEQKAITAKWRRERIAVAAMTGILASQKTPFQFSHEAMADDAVQMADALIERLDGAKK